MLAARGRGGLLAAPSRTRTPQAASAGAVGVVAVAVAVGGVHVRVAGL